MSQPNIYNTDINNMNQDSSFSNLNVFSTFSHQQPLSQGQGHQHHQHPPSQSPYMTTQPPQSHYPPPQSYPSNPSTSSTPMMRQPMSNNEYEYGHHTIPIST